MKNFACITFMTFLASHIIIAQDTIPNGNFEYWSGLNTPTHWQTTNQFLPPGIYTVKKVNSEVQGDFAMQMQTILLDGLIIPGVATIGDLDIGNTSGGIPFSERPSSMSGYVKHPSTGDDVAIFAEFIKAGETMGFGTWSTSDSIGDFIPFNIPITFVNSEVPDTLNITILTDPFGPGSTLIVDGLQFNYPLTDIKHQSESQFTVFPNPCKDYIWIEGITEQVEQLRIIDLNGQIVKEIRRNRLSTIDKININELPPGMYFLVAKKANQVYRKKIIKN